MSWAKIDDKSAFHAKVVAAGNAAWGAQVRMIAWSKDHGTDGFVADALALAIAVPDELERLVAVGLLTRRPGGYQIHDFTEWNGTERERLAAIEKKKKAGRIGGLNRKANTQSSAKADAQASATDLLKQTSSIPQAKGSGEGFVSLSGERVQGEGPGLIAVCPGNAVNTDGVEDEPEPVAKLKAEERYAIAYAEGQKRASGAEFPVPSEPWERGAIAQLVLTYLAGLRGDELLEGIRTLSADYRRARDENSRFESGFRPKKCLEWAAGIGWKRKAKPPKPKREEPVQLVNPAFALESITAAIGGGGRRL